MLPDDPRMRWLLGAGAAWTALLFVLYSRIGVSTPRATPASATKPIKGWMLVGGDVLKLRPGVRYRGCIRLPWIVPHVATSTVKERAEKEGFRDVVVGDRKPPAPGWPDAECEYFVEATYGGKSERSLERPGAIPLAWEETTK